MNRYYCKNCGSEAIKGDNARRSNDFVVYCPMCEDENGNEVKMTELPDYETPEQYEKRTRKKWNGAVWTRCKREDCYGCDKYDEETEEWEVVTAKRLDYRNICDGFEMVCAQSPEPPPDDWKPEGV